MLWAGCYFVRNLHLDVRGVDTFHEDADIWICYTDVQVIRYMSTSHVCITWFFIELKPVLGHFLAASFPCGRRFSMQVGLFLDLQLSALKSEDWIRQGSGPYQKKQQMLVILSENHNTI